MTSGSSAGNGSRFLLEEAQKTVGLGERHVAPQQPLSSS